jgi:RNA recognition motif-containing protein
LDPATRQRKGLAYVTFTRSTDALAAYEALDKKSFQGRLLHILAAVDRKAKFEVVEGDGKKKSVKDEKNAKRKATAGKEFNWSMLYMNVGTFYFEDNFLMVCLILQCVERRCSLIDCRSNEHQQIGHLKS